MKLDIGLRQTGKTTRILQRIKTNTVASLLDRSSSVNRVVMYIRDASMIKLTNDEIVMLCDMDKELSSELVCNNHMFSKRVDCANGIMSVKYHVDDSCSREVEILFANMKNITDAIKSGSMIKYIKSQMEQYNICDLYIDDVCCENTDISDILLELVNVDSLYKQNENSINIHLSITDDSQYINNDMFDAHKRT